MRMQDCPDRSRKRRGAWVLPALTDLLVALALAAPAPAQTGSATDAEQASDMPVVTDVPLEPVDAYRLALLRMRAHLAVARALAQQGEPGDAYHMGEALRRIFEEAEAALEERSAPLTEAVLRELEGAARLEPARALPAIESTIHAVNGSFAQTGALDRKSVLDLVEALLRRAVANYQDAVPENEVVDLRAYQTGRGLVTQSEALVRHSTPLQDVAGQEELLKTVTLIRQAWPGIRPPPIVFDSASVAGRLDETLAVIGEMR